LYGKPREKMGLHPFRVTRATIKALPASPHLPRPYGYPRDRTVCFMYKKIYIPDLQ
jgi:hypothetical protein